PGGGCRRGGWFGGTRGRRRLARALRRSRRFGCGAAGRGCFARDRLVACLHRLVGGIGNLPDALGEFQALLGVALEFGVVGGGPPLTGRQQRRRCFPLVDPGARLGLGLDLARTAGVVQRGTRREQFVLGLATLLLQLGKRVLSFLSRLGTGLV